VWIDEYNTAEAAGRLDELTLAAQRSVPRGDLAVKTDPHLAVPSNAYYRSSSS
jgi:hypothetical protein